MKELLPATENKNTPEYWDSVWSRSPEIGVDKSPVRDRVVRLLAGLPERDVYEYGFGGMHLARMIGKSRWRGFDFAASAVKNARAEGFTAQVGRCRDAQGWKRSYLVALEVLEHLDEAEMREFLSRSKNTPHAFFSVPNGYAHFHLHMRGWTATSFREFLSEYFPHVKVEVVGRWILAHCSQAAPPVEPLLTVGCSTLLDFHGTLYTLASCLTHQGTFNGKVEYVIVDNHPDPVDDVTRSEVADMKMLVTGEGGRYVQWSEKQGTYPGKNQLAIEARGKWVLTMDSHVLLTPGAIERVLEVIESDPESDDFFHFPCLYRRYSEGEHAGKPVSVDYRNQDYIYRKHGGKTDMNGKSLSVYGWTGEAVKGGDPYPIAAMITSCYLVRREAWITGKGYEPILGNYGGWEGPLQLKWWLLGREVRSMRYATPPKDGRYLHHWHLFNHFPRLKNATGGSVKRPDGDFRIHTGVTKQRNFAASSAVIGGESWVKRHCELAGWNFRAANIQEGMAAGLALRPWMVENLARPEWEDITVFFEWMKSQGIPGALTEW